MNTTTKKLLIFGGIVAVIIIFIAKKKKQENEENPYADIPPRDPAVGKTPERDISEYKKVPDIEQNMSAYDVVSQQDVSDDSLEDNVKPSSVTVDTVQYDLSTTTKRTNYFDANCR